MGYFARNLWRKIWDDLSARLASECDAESVANGGENGDAMNCFPEERLDTLDKDNDGKASIEEIQAALGDLVGLSIDNRELSLAKFVHDYADTNGTGEVTLEDMEIFCTEMQEVHERDQWRLAFAKAEKEKQISSQY